MKEGVTWVLQVIIVVILNKLVMSVEVFTDSKRKSKS